MVEDTCYTFIDGQVDFDVPCVMWNRFWMLKVPVNMVSVGKFGGCVLN